MIHKEGYPSLFWSGLLLGTLIVFSAVYAPGLLIPSIVLTLILFGFLLNFFRNPGRSTSRNEQHVIAPADGKVVVIEETTEGEYFKDKRIQVSIFMSPMNVHVNRNPVSGTVKLMKYHPGKYLVAWHPKSSTENERTTMVIDTGRTQVLMRQIAGFLARRIVWYPKEGDKVIQGEQMGFIKFGSRVDILLPVGTTIRVKINEMVRGGETVIADLP